MSAIVVLALSADRADAGRIADALVAARLDVRLFSYGEKGSEDAAGAAQCALFIWCGHTGDADAAGYRELAGRVAADGRAIGVAIARGAGPPVGAPMTTYPLTARRLRPGLLSRWIFGDLHLRDVVAAARSKAAGIDPPPPSANTRVLRRQAWAVLVAVGAVWGSYTGLESISKRIPWPHPREAAAWKAIRPGSCDDLRAFLLKYPDSKDAGRARTVLATPRAQSVAERTERVFPVGDVLGLPPPSADEAAARRAAKTRLAGEASRICSGYARTVKATLTASRTGDERLACQKAAGGWTCQIDGQALCNLAEITSTPSCPLKK